MINIYVTLKYDRYFTFCAESEKALAAQEEDVKARPFAKSYYCSTCQLQLQLTPIEILRHKKNHQDNF